ncbi:hypothetical protein [Undibacterium sp.]|uniref:hypothetical protein n=1 Tax=Undibacterium sp. TaxID=1914977 RepID=UPI00374DF911
MDNLQLSQSGSFALNSGALATATTANLVKTTAAINYTVDGQFFSFAATDNIPFATQFVSQTFNPASLPQAVSTTCLYGVFLDAAGVVSFVQAKAVSTSDLANGVAPLPFTQNTDVGIPAAGKPRGRACIGFVRVANASTAPFIFGTTSLGTAGLTVSYINTSTVPGEPLRS